MIRFAVQSCFEAECTAAHEAAPVMVNGSEVVSHKQAMRELGVLA